MKKHSWPDILLLIASLLLGGVFFLSSAIYIRLPNAELKSNNVFSPAAFKGEYSVDGGAWLPLTADTVFDTDHLHTVRARGHFTETIEKNQLLMLRITDLRVALSVNGRTVFTFGQPDELSPGMRSGGNVWQSFTSQGISPTDVVEIELSNIYVHVHPASFRAFFDEMYYGSADSLYRMTLSRNSNALKISLLIIAVGLMELVAALVQLVLREKGALRTLYTGGLATFGGLWFFIQFDVLSLLIPYPAVNNQMDVLSAYLMSVFFGLYLSTYLTEGRKKTSRIACGITLAAASAVLVTAFTTAVDAYDLVSAGWYLGLCNLVVHLICLALEYRAGKTMEVQALLISLIPVVLGVLMDFTGWFAGVNDTGWLRIFFLVFIFVQLFYMMWEIRETGKQAARTKQLEYDILQANVAIMLSQIQPHFLYNALNTIQALCRKNSAQAEEVVQKFSDYLRGNLDSLKRQEPVLFETELAHTACYLDIEKYRFGSKVQVEYDFATTDFLLPVLTVQPIVENAVRYGVTKKKGGGTVTISTRQTDNIVTITVSDDGAGFDPFETQEDGRSHVGINNVKNRLETMCGGTLAVESVKGKGTTVTLTVPQTTS